MRLAVLISICLLAMCATAQSKSAKAAGKNAATKDKNALFNRLSDQFLKEQLAMNPASASEAGYHKHRGREGKVVELDAVLDDFSPAAMKRQSAFFKAWNARFEKETPVNSLAPNEAADRQLIDDQIALQLLELDDIQNQRHNPTRVVETIGNALFLPLTQSYAPKDIRVGQVLSRMRQIPRAVTQAKQLLLDADPIFIKVAKEENDGNVDTIENTVKAEITPGSKLESEYKKVAPVAVAALKDFSAWLDSDLAKRKTDRTWRLGKGWYAKKFRYSMETSDTPEQLVSAADAELNRQRAQMMELALPLHKQWFPEHPDHSDLSGIERENVVLKEVLDKIGDDHPKRDELMDAVKRDLDGIKQFIREKKIVSLGERDNLKVIPTPSFMRGIYSVAGFHSAPPLEPKAEAQYWVTPIDPKMPDEKAESKLREYNNWMLKWLSIHEALPGHYVQAEHANNIQPESRRVLRNLLGNGSSVEGWAEYIATVMTDEGYMNHDPRFVLSRKKVLLRAIANTILDVKLQTMGMTDQEALDLMMNRCFQTRAEAEGKLQRAKLSSTQLPSYYFGYRAWMDFRDRYQKAHADNFNMQEFHDAVLDMGPLPVDGIEKLMK
jgi:uncharacterized protein (DUF885 family)